MKKVLLFLCLIMIHSSFSQDRIYIAAELEGGFLITHYKSQSPSLSSIVNEEEKNHNIKISASVILEWDNKMSFEAGIAQNMRQWNILGKKPNSTLEVKQTQYYPSVFVGGYYDIPFNASNTNLRFYIGSKLSADFLNYNSLNKTDGTDLDNVNSVTEESNKFAFNVIPEIGIKGRFKNGNIWLFGIKYCHPLSKNILNGYIKHNLKKVTQEQIDYHSTGQIFALSFKYGFSI
ncbi:PorT family protein [Flavobacterium psychrophilum]